MGWGGGRSWARGRVMIHEGVDRSMDRSVDDQALKENANTS